MKKKQKREGLGGLKSRLVSTLAVGIYAVFCHTVVLADHPSDGVFSAQRTRPLMPASYGLDIHYSKASYPKYHVMGEQILPSGGHTIGIAWEWLPFKGPGKLGLGIGFSVFWMNDIATNDGGAAAINVYELDPHLSFRLQYVKDQLLVPFVKVGPGCAWSKQTGAGDRRTQSYYSVDRTVGIALQLNVFNSSTANRMYQSTGVNASYFVFEYTSSMPIGIKGTGDLSKESYQFGLRFEM